MTDHGIADKVYMEPLTEETLVKILEKESPDGILSGFGGQTGLNLAMAMEDKGILDDMGIQLLGVNRNSIKKAEDREEFKKLMLEINEPIPPSTIATTMEECEAFIDKTGYPVIIRPAYTLGGTGGGFAYNDEDLKKYATRGMESSAIGQILLEKSIAGWKEIEYEIIRDAKDNCIIICSMENLDPVGVHTGDSIVVAPNDRVINQIVEKRLRDEVARGVQTIQYQVVTLMTTNGQAPFITVFMYLGEAKGEQERKDLALCIEEMLRQRYQGVKNEAGVWITPAFPKLI